MENALNAFDTITLSEMDSFRFMDRMVAKYPFPSQRIPELLKKISIHYKVLEINGVRKQSYLSTYLDTPSHDFYLQHTRGFSQRFKVRYRHYETSGDSFLEVKMKNAKNRTFKWRISKDTNDELDKESIRFLSSHIHKKTNSIHPTLVTKFTRITLVGINTNERITLDHNIAFGDGVNALIEHPYLAIAEIKSEMHSHHSPMISALKEMMIRSSGFSKYCVGRALLGTIPKANMMKQKILLLQKIENGNNVCSACQDQDI